MGSLGRRSFAQALRVQKLSEPAVLISNANDCAGPAAIAATASVLVEYRGFGAFGAACDRRRAGWMLRVFGDIPDNAVRR